MREVLRCAGKLALEVCGFCFGTFHGAVEKVFMECHRRRQLSELTASGWTLLEVLALVCEIYHRLIQARWLALDVEQLRDVVRQPRVADRHDR